MDFDVRDPACPSRQVLGLVGDTWTVLILETLADGPARNGELARRSGGIAPSVLSRTLRALERDGLVSRTAYPEVPPRVVYDLTDAGRTLVPLLHATRDWVEQAMPSIIAARSAYDERA